MSKLLLRFVQISDSHFSPHGDNRTQQLLNATSTKDKLFVNTVNNIIRAAGNLPEPAATTKDIMEFINNLPFDVDFVLHTGDVGFDIGSLGDYSAIHTAFADCRFPIFFLSGNHDHSEYLQMEMGHLETVKRSFDYVLPHPYVHIVCLDTSHGFLNHTQIAWLENQLKSEAERPLIIALHHHVVPLASGFPDTVILRNHEKLREIIRSSRERLRGVFHGHLHATLDTVFEGISYYGCPSTWQQFDITPSTDISLGSYPECSPGLRIVTITESMTHVATIHLNGLSNVNNAGISGG